MGDVRPRVTRRALGALARRPDLWPVALVVVVRLAPRSWWRRWPPLPTPDPDYLAFRIATFHGEDGASAIDGGELVDYLGWVRKHRDYERTR